MKLTTIKLKSKQTTCVVAICAAIVMLLMAGRAQLAYTITNTTSGSYLSAANPTLNYGSAGTFAIASASLSKGELDTVLMFNTAAAVSQFNTTYGVGHWTITGVTLSLASNFGSNGATPGSQFNTISGGNFNIDWLSANNWLGGFGGGSGGTGYPNNSSVSFDDKTNLLNAGYDSLGTFTYTPPGNNIYDNYSLPLDANLVTGAAAGGGVSLYFTPADNQISYLFNTPKFGANFPELTLDITQVPEPGTLAMLVAGLGGFLVTCRQKRKS
jgi:hypothetical protein